MLQLRIELRFQVYKARVIATILLERNCARGGIRTHNLRILSLSPLPIGLQGQNGAASEIRTHNSTCLRRSPLPIGIQQQSPVDGIRTHTVCVLDAFSLPRLEYDRMNSASLWNRTTPNILMRNVWASRPMKQMVAGPRVELGDFLVMSQASLSLAPYPQCSH
jgi:hypothetical protein